MLEFKWRFENPALLFLGLFYAGLAYMTYTFVNVHPERFQSLSLDEPHAGYSLIESSRRSRECNWPESISNIMHLEKYSLEAGWHPELHVAGFQWNLSKVLEEGHNAFLKLPKWLDFLPVEEVLEQMYKAVTLLYLVSAGEPKQRTAGNFVVLHLITSLWGADQVCTVALLS
jgi:hypothetical protein